MLDYKKINEQNNIVEYEFYIEGDSSDIGHVSFDKESGIGSLHEENPSFSQKRYGNKLIDSLEQQYANGSIKDTGTVMWY